jgi:hypothetical protein
MSLSRLFSVALFFWAGLVRAEPMLTVVPRVRFWSLRFAVAETRSERAGMAAPVLGALLVPGLLYRYEGNLFTFATWYGEPNARVEDVLGDFATALGDQASAPPWFGAEPFEQRAFDFGRRCFNTCRLGGWGSCAMETRAKQDECVGIAGRTLVSAAARRAPLIRDVLKLVGSRTTALPTDVDRGLRLSANLFRGGGTLGFEFRW